MMWTGKALADSLGEMHTQDSVQYGIPCVVAFPQDSAERIIEHCRRMGAIWTQDPDGEQFCVVLRFDVGPELWTESALRKSRL